MEARLLVRCIVPSSSFLPASPHLAVHKRFMACWVVGLRVNAVLTRPAEEHLNGIRDSDTDVVYKDSWFDRLAIHHLSKSVQDTTGHFNAMEGYDSLVDAARAVLKNFSPDSKLKREYFAAFTTLFFTWLIGPLH